ncbi:DUF3761 domain-containing protein [Streptomyces caniferus]|uniref:DUF3761 domain-containing protein n=1 Tax=Streptomyces caniferus TaxID=285557 RepID=UPI0037117CDA
MTGNQGSMSPEDKKNAKLGCAVIAVFVLLVGGCVNLMNGDDGAKSSVATSAAKSVATAVPRATPDASDARGDAITVPDYTGRNLQAAQDAAQGEGIHLLKSRDLSVRHRMQVWDRNWQVCDQEPAAGSVMRDTETLTFAVVKTGESCDAPDAAEATGGDGAAEPTQEPADADGSVSGRGSTTSGGSTASGGAGADDGGSGADEGGSSGGSSSSGGAGSGGGSGSASGSGSTSGGGEEEQAPAGASAQCNDGTYSYSQHRRGTCSHHHGVAVWLRSLPA